MIPAIEFQEANFIFEKPSNMTDGQCLPLRVWKGDDPFGFPFIITKWQLTNEELEEIKNTGVIYLRTIGNTLPPVIIEVENPFTE